MPRRRTLCLLTSILAFFTGLALLGTGLSIGAARVADPRPAATEQVVRAFYAAVNQTIATGDTRSLDGVVAADLVMHGSLATLAPGRDGLVRYLASLHATNPQLDLTVDRVVTARDQALVHLAVRGREEANFLGSPVRGGPPPWGAVDAVTVAGGQVVEFWGGATGVALREPLGETPFAINGPSKRLVSLDRLMIPPGASFTARGAEEARLFFVEAGTVTVTSTSLTIRWPTSEAPPVEFMEPSSDGTAWQTSPPLKAGDFLSLPTWSRTEVRNIGRQPASMLMLATGISGPPGGWTSDPARPDAQLPTNAGTGLTAWQAGLAQISPSGASIAPLTGNATTTLPRTRAVVAVGRVALAPGAMLPASEVTGPRLLVVEEGTLDLDTVGGTAWVYRGGGSTVDAGTLGVGSGAVLHADTTAMIRNTGGELAVFTIIAILPDDAVTSGL